MPPYPRQLTDVLSEHLSSSWNLARLKFMARYVGSLLQMRTTNGKELALTLNPEVKNKSNYRRIQRFMADYDFGFDSFGRFLLWLLPQGSGFVVVMDRTDRTEWHFGSKPVNVLMIGVAYKGAAFPVIWEVLSSEKGQNKGKAGCSSTAERKELFELLGLTFVWAHLIGQERHARDPLRVKKHGWREKSFFRYGLELLRSIMLNWQSKKEEFRRCIRVLVAPSEFFVV
jgi:hypothetical protein